jgi:hypothetical protein
MLRNGPEAEISEESREGGGLIVGIQAAGVGEDPGVAATKGVFLEADSDIFDAGEMSRAARICVLVGFHGVGNFATVVLLSAVIEVVFMTEAHRFSEIGCRLGFQPDQTG